MSGFLSLLFLIDLSGFFHLGHAGAKNTGNIHPFKALFVRFCRVPLRFFKRRGCFRSFRFLNNRSSLSAVKNSGRFHACFSFLFLLKSRGNRTGGFSVLKKATLPVLYGVFCGVFCGRPFSMDFGFPARRLLVFSVLGQRFARQNHGASGKCRRIDGVLGRWPGPWRGLDLYRSLRSRTGRLWRMWLIF